MNNFLVIDVESDGPCPGLYSMVSIGAISWGGETFYGKCAPISDKYIPEALAISNISRVEHLHYPSPYNMIKDFYQWLIDFKRVLNGKRPVMWSDNPAFDWQWVNYYLHSYMGENPLGFSARRIGDFYAGTKHNVKKANEWKKLRKTKHTHHPVDDARGNMEALKIIIDSTKGKTNEIPSNDEVS